MKNAPLFLLIILLLIVPIVYSSDILSNRNSPTVPVVYCMRMKYRIEINSENTPECVFEDETSCDATEFYKGLCGNERIEELPDRTEGQDVYIEFEKCEDGLIVSKKKYLLDQPVCFKPTIIDIILSWF